MTKKSEETEPVSEGKPLDVDSTEREGNDIPSLVGSGAPMVKIRANVNYMGLRPGQEGVFIQSEELRLGIQGELATLVDG